MPDTGERENIDMNKEKEIYSDAPKNISNVIMKGEILDDFLPPPEELIRKESKIKITITLNSESVDFFKKHARENNVKYQKMINEVLSKYVQKYKESVMKN